MATGWRKRVSCLAVVVYLVALAGSLWAHPCLADGDAPATHCQHQQAQGDEDGSASHACPDHCCHASSHFVGALTVGLALPRAILDRPEPAPWMAPRTVLTDPPTPPPRA